jgi:hypothetical protein
MNLSTLDLTNLLTYNGLFDYVSLINHIHVAQEVERDAEHKSACVIEWHTPEHPILWSASGWVSECKRREDLFRAEKESKEKPRPQITEKRTKSPIDELKAELLRCLSSGNIQAAMETQQKIKDYGQKPSSTNNS